MPLVRLLPSLILLLPVCTIAQNVTVHPESLDFGTVWVDTFGYCHSDRTLDKEVWVLNSGQEPFVITRVSWPGEVCAPRFSRDTVVPGDSTCITLFCRSFGYEKSLERILYITTSAGDAHVRLQGRFRMMPHILEIPLCQYSILGDADKVLPDTTVSLSVWNVHADSISLSGGFSTSPSIRASFDSLPFGPGDGKEITFTIRREPDGRSGAYYLYAETPGYRELIRIQFLYRTY